MIHGTISLKQVISKLYRDLQINEELNEAYISEWIGEALNKIGAYAQYTESKDCIKLENGKAKLPINFYKLKDISYNGYPISWSSPSLATTYGCEGSNIPKCCYPNNFYIDGCYIITDIEINQSESNQNLNIVYLGIAVDDEGYPLIPDDVYYIEACAKYVTYMMDHSEWRKGNITDKVFQFSEREWLWAVGAAKGAANMPDTNMMENLKNVWVRLIPNQNGFYKGFRNNPERLKRY